MGEANIAFLKQKCNKLIDKATQMKQQIADQDALIEQLQEEKHRLEKEIQEEQQDSFVGEPVEREPAGLMVLPKEDPKEGQDELMDQRLFSTTYQQVYAMMQALSSQMAARPQEEIVIRQVSTGGKVLELITDGIGKLSKVLIMGGLMLLVSLAATVLINADLRNLLIEFVKNCMR